MQPIQSIKVCIDFFQLLELFDYPPSFLFPGELFVASCRSSLSSIFRILGLVGINNMFFTGAKRRHYELTLVSSNRMIPHYHLNLFFWIFLKLM